MIADLRGSGDNFFNPSASQPHLLLFAAVEWILRQAAVFNVVSGFLSGDAGRFVVEVEVAESSRIRL